VADYQRVMPAAAVCSRRVLKPSDLQHTFTSECVRGFLFFVSHDECRIGHRNPLENSVDIPLSQMPVPLVTEVEVG